MAAEDYFDEFTFDEGPEEPYEGWTAAHSVAREERFDRRIEVDLPGSIALDEMNPGETFRFATPIKSANVYVVISSKDLDDEHVHYVLLNNGKHYSSRPSKRVMQVDVRVSIDEKRKRGRV